MRAAIYARVSSAAQRDAQTIEAQLKALPEYVARQGWELTGTYVDDGQSAKAGNLERRDGLKRLLADATARAFDVVVVWEIDRLTRSEDQAERGAILGALAISGVKVASPNGGLLDPRSSEGDLLLGIKAWAAADWLRRHRAGIMAGKDRAIAGGRKPAGPTLYGYTYDRETGAWGIDEPAAAIVREVFRRVAAGDSCSMIADDFAARGVPRPRKGEWTRERVYQLVARRAYMGEWQAHKSRRLVVAIPSLVTEDEWRAAERALVAHGKRGLRRTRHHYLLEGFATCSLCGEPVSIMSAANTMTNGATHQPNGKPYVRGTARYTCRRRRRHYSDGMRCELPYHRTDEIDARLWGALCDLLTRPRVIEAALRDRQRMAAGDTRDWRGDVAGFEARLAQLQRAEGGALARFRRELVSEGALDAELGAIARERQVVARSLEAARRAAAAAGSKHDAVTALLERVDVLRHHLPKLVAGEPRRQAVRQLLVGPAVLTPRDVRAGVTLDEDPESVGLVEVSG